MDQDPNVNKHPRRLWVLIAVVVTLVALALIFGGRDSNTPEPAATSEEHTAYELAQNAPSSASSTAAPDTEAPPLDTSNYEQCRPFLQELQSLSARWGREHYKSWARYLNEGYSLDEVTLAIDRIANPNFAAMFRATQLRSQSSLTLQSMALHEALRAEMPEYAEEIGSIWVAPASLDRLSFDTMSNAEKHRLLSDEAFTVDEIALAILEEQSDDDILMLMDYVESLDAVVGYDRLEATSILDYAISSSRATLVDAMLRRGLSPTSDSYLGSSMEWALRGLTHAPEERRDDAAHIVSRLKQLGASARFRSQNEALVEGFFPRNFYRFNAEQLASIEDKYQLNLLNIASREVPQVDENHSLIRELEAKRIEYLANSGFGENFRENQAACNQTVRNVNSQWERQPAHTVLNQMIEEYGEDSSRLVGALADTDPMLVDLYRQRLDFRARRSERFEEITDIFALLNAGEVGEAFEQLEALSLTNAEKRFARNELLRFDLEFYDLLRRSSLWGEGLQLADIMHMRPTLERVELLEAAGADLRGTDVRNNTFLYYAVERGQMDLVTYLEAQGYPFSLDSMGQDPLHLALGPAMQSSHLDRVEALVDTLMKYRPTIDEHHRSRMALLKLRTRNVYESIISRHAELEVGSDTPLPVVE